MPLLRQPCPPWPLTQRGPQLTAQSDLPSPPPPAPTTTLSRPARRGPEEHSRRHSLPSPGLRLDPGDPTHPVHQGASYLKKKGGDGKGREPAQASDHRCIQLVPLGAGRQEVRGPRGPRLHGAQASRAPRPGQAPQAGLPSARGGAGLSGSPGPRRAGGTRGRGSPRPPIRRAGGLPGAETL